MKQFKFVLVMIISIALVMLMASCKKSDSGSDTTGPNNPNTGSYGSGSLSFNTNSSTAGNSWNISGSFNPTSTGQTGSGVMSWYDASSNVAWVYAFLWRSSNDWDYAILELERTPSSNKVGTGTYSFASGTDNTAMLIFIKGASSQTSTNGNYYMLESGTANITSYSSTGMKGNFSGTGMGISGSASGTPVQVSAGSFDVTFGTAYGTP